MISELMLTTHHLIVEKTLITEISKGPHPLFPQTALRFLPPPNFSFSFFFLFLFLFLAVFIEPNSTLENRKVRKNTGKSTSFTAEMKPPLSSPTSSSVLRKARFSPYLFTLLAFIVFVAVLYGEDFRCIGELGSESESRPIGEFVCLSSAIFTVFCRFRRLRYIFLL